MARYNLYLMDATRDPRVIRRIAALTQVDPAVLAPHLLRFPFLVLREVPLSQAVGIRRELERLGLQLSIENLPPERITGNSRHPLASEKPPDAEGPRPVGNGRDPVVLEAGSGFQELKDEPVAAPPREPSGPSRLGRLLALLGEWLGHRRVRQALALGLLALALFWVGYRFGQPAGTPLTPAEQANVEVGLERLLVQTRQAVGTESLSDEERVVLLDEVRQLAEKVQAAGRTLPARFRKQMEELEAFAATLELRGAQPAEDSLPSAALNDFSDPDLDDPAVGQELGRLLDDNQAPRNRMDLNRLEFLQRAAAGELRIRKQTDAARQRLEDLAQRARDRMELTRARVLAGSLELRGTALIPDGKDLRVLADVPDSTRLEVRSGEGVDVVEVVDGQVLILGIADRLNSVSVRLAALDRQPSTVRRVLEAGLRFMDPAVYFSTLPGSSLPTGRFTKRRESLEEALGEVDVPEGAIVLSRGNFLEASFPPRIEEARAREVLGRCAKAYLETRQWPRRVELDLDGKHYSLTGMDLWMLSRGGLD